jgi:hypothetical protein
MKEDKLHPAIQFLEVLYPSQSTLGYLNFRFITPEGEVRKHAFITPREVRKKLPPLLKKYQGCNVFFQVAVTDGEGGKGHIQFIPAVVFDVDFRGDFTCEEWTRIAPLPGEVKTSIMVNSGSGRQGYYLLKEPLTAEDIPKVEEIQKRLVPLLKADPGATDASHLLRLPGTLNLKYDPPREAKVVRLNPEARYELSDFESLPPLEEEPRPPKDHDREDFDEESQRLCFDFFTEKIKEKGSIKGLDGKGGYKALCPLHEEEGPSFTFNVKRGVFHCFGCGRSGGIKDFSELAGQPIPEELLAAIHLAAAPVFDKDDGEKGKPSLAKKLIELAEKEIEEFFTDQEREPWARVKVGNHYEYYPIASRDFREWLSRLLWMTEKIAPYSEALKSAFAVLSAKAKYEGERYTLHTRIAWYEDAIWIDLVNEKWQAIRISSRGWEVVSNPPIIFRRSPHQKPLNVGGELKGLDLRQWWNLRGEDDFLLATIWLVTSFIPDFPHPVLSFHGPHGSGKTTIGRTLKSIVDPQEANWLSIPYDKTELAQSFQHHFICPFDNVSGLPRWLSDAICSAVTGDGFSKRKLYTDNEDVVFSYQRTIILNGINVAVSRPDLMDRSLILKLDRLDKVRTEKELREGFENILPDIRATIFSLISKVLAIRPKVKLSASPRMADFACWGVAAARAMGIKDGQFLQAYFANIGQQHEMVIESSPVGQAIRSFMEDRGEWTGLAGELLPLLETEAEKLGIKTKIRGWPTQPNGLTRKLRTLKVTLDGVGIKFVDEGHGKKGRHISFFRKYRENTVTTVTEVETVDIPGLEGDDKGDGEKSLPSPPLNHRHQGDDGDDKVTVGDDNEFQSPSPDKPSQTRVCAKGDGGDDKFRTSSKKGEGDEVINLDEIDISDLIEEDDELARRSGQL